MEISVASVTISVAVVVVSWWVWRTLQWVWFKPKMLESYLRRQGLAGTHYTPLIGDLKRNVNMLTEATSKPIKLTDDITPRLLPHPFQMLKTHGRTFFTWLGPKPTITIMEPELIKEVFNKVYDYPKAQTFLLSSLIATGIINYDEYGTCVPPELQRDVISRTAFGSSYKEGQRIFELQAELVHLILQAFWKVYIPGYRYLPTKGNRRMKTAASEIQVILRGIVNKRVRAREAGKAPNDDLLGILLESNLGQAKGNGMSTEDVMEECKLFYFAGQETTSVLLVWTIVLAHHQDWQARAREEVKQVFGDKEPDTEGLNQLKVMTMILYEVLRPYPPVTHLTRAIHKEMKLGDLTLPGGVHISLPIMLVQRDTKLWGNDAAEFKPERFKDGLSKATKSQVSFFPFAWGPRICIGQNFVMLEAKMAMALILQRFSIELSPSYVHAPQTVWVWFKPKTLERYLRRQGLAGTPYTPLVGDLKRNFSMLAEARSKPIKLTDDITPRVVPYPLQMLKTHGMVPGWHLDSSVFKTVKRFQLLYLYVVETGRTFYTWLGPIPTINIMDPEQIKEVFNKVYDFQKVHTFPLARLIAAGLVSYDGDKWAKHRRIINPAFHLEKIKNMVPAFHQSCSEIVGEWDKLVSDKESSCEVDVWPGLVSMTADVISRTAFGSSYVEGQRIFELQAELAQLIIQAFQKAFIPGYHYLPTKGNRRMKAAAREIQVILRGIVNKRLRAREAGEAPSDDLLGILLESNLGQTEGNGMSTEDVMEECKLFYFAGQETTTVLLVWTMVLLSQHQDWQARAREEVKQVFGDKEPDTEGLNQLKVMTMILYEVLRLYPPVSQLTRAIHKEMKLGDLTLPGGVHISLPIMLVQRDTELWGKDAAEFKPERFKDGLSKATKSQVSFFPFAWGQRICIGQNFALLEAKMAMALILQKFSFELSPSYVHAPDTVFTIHPQFGAPLILHKL
ncbi:unnamed protein product [Arabidopsis arenosa]|uniref:Cytochrome P450 n=1 Tax=Arabidopsis arenosa TaxID=38785 RepID=A0A8S1ZUW4_ARAAE|nr:unnamed protein product [Arabidopsis arenosa]